jgi:phospholipase/carboxylesterase
MTDSNRAFDGVEIETAADIEFAVIWLHGLGADGNDFVPLVPELVVPRPTRFVFPHAPVRPITINAGYPMRAWYDIVSFDRSGVEDAAGIQASAAFARELIAREESRGIPVDHIVLAGFSQGGAIALYTVLTETRRLAGALALSTYLPLATSVLAGATPACTLTPVWMGHGDHDPVIDLSLADRSRRGIEAAGVELEWHTYPMPHSVCAAEVRDIASWLAQRQLAV